MKRTLLTLAAMVLAFAGTARAQDAQGNAPDTQTNSADAQGDGADAQAPATDGQSDAAAAPGVGRVSLIHGDVSTQHSDATDWTAATLNTPVVLGDSIATGPGGRTEVELDYADVIRMDQNTNAKIADLTRKHIQVQLGLGLMDLSVIPGTEAQAEVDTPNMGVHPVGDGIYRVEVRSDSDTRVTVVRGQADISTQQGSTRVSAGQMITIRGTDNPQYQTSHAPARDEWDDWNSSRDRHINQAASWQHTDRYYVGTQDLDPYGHWQNVPDYGNVWVPSAGADWAPYRDGRWTYEPYYGWTWVSYEPWGWAPYHYGRWFMYGGSWCWWPGPVVGYPGYYPVWAPAYVSFFGFGGHVGFGIGIGFGVGFGFGRVGWLAIGPGDFYHPWYGAYGRRYGVAAFGARVGGGYAPLGPRGLAHPYSNIGLAATDARVRGGLSSMGSGEFGHAAVPAHQAAIDSRTFRAGGMVSGRMPVQPTKASYQSVSRPVNPSSVPSHPMAQQHLFNGAQTGSRISGSNSLANRNAASAAGAGGNRGFTAPTATHTMVNGNSSLANHTGASADGNASAARATGTAQGNWHTFSPPSSHSTAGNGGGASTAGRAYSAPSNGGYSRPSLNMNHPIVAPRSSSSYGGGNSTYRAPANTYRPPTNTYRPPNSGSNNRPSPAYRAPSNSGGNNNRGGSGRSGSSGNAHPSGGSGHSGGRPH
jgi:ferric-dicitrate binding protein FerR (iron transport regulator)